MNLFQIIYLIGYIAASIIRATYGRKFKNQTSEKSIKLTLDAVFLGLIGIGMIIPLIYLFSPWLYFADYTLPAEWLGLVGILVMALSIWVLYRSHADLGRQWSPSLEIRENHQLVTEGIFKQIRHPMYAAHWLMGIAQILLLHNWIAGFSLIIPFIPFYFFRTKNEEKMMIQQFGEEYRNYAAQTPRLIPGIF